MERYSANLRFFFGPEASTVWSFCRDRNRALRSIELYRLVIKQLRTDLETEKSRRGTLVRVRSNEVTEVKEKLGKCSQEKISLSRELANNKNQIDTLPERIFVSLRSLVTSSPGVGAISEAVVKDEKKLQKLETEIEKIAEELFTAVYRQNAALDPIDDLNFAIAHLSDEINKCRQKIKKIEEKTSRFIVQECLEGGPVHLECMLANGFQPADNKTFCDLYLKIHDEAYGLINCMPGPQEAEVVDIKETVLAAFETNKISSRANVSMSGRGSHHRKVRRGKRRVWREFDVKFSGRVSTNFVFQQRRWEKFSAGKALQSKACEEFHKGRNLKLQEYQKEFETSRESLLESAALLFEQF